jgi:hypothetical protein
LDTVDAALIQNQKIVSIEMNYLKEVSLNDMVTIQQKTIEDTVTFAVAREDKTCFAMQLHRR